MKRFLAFLLAMYYLVAFGTVMAESLTVDSSSNKESEKYVCENYTYTILEDGTAEIVSVNLGLEERENPTEELTIPTELDGIPVTVIGEHVSWWYGLKRIIVPEGITILKWSSLSCITLRSVELPRSLIFVEDGTLLNCENLREIKLPSDHPTLEFTKGMLISREDRRLIRCLPQHSAKQAVIPKGTAIIGMYAFNDCKKMQSVTIPDSVTEIRRGAFCFCEELRSVTIPGCVKSIGREAFGYCKKMKSVKLGEGIETLGYFAFNHCDKLERVNLPMSLTSFGTNPFLGCNKLKTVTLAKDHPTLKMVKNVLFDKLGETLLWYPSRLTAKSYAIPEGTKAIAPQAFHGGKFRTVTIPDSVTEIGSYAFSECKNLGQIDLPDSVTVLGKSAFELCEHLTHATMPRNLTELSEELFYCCSRLETVVLPEGILEIPNMMFMGCEAMKTLTLPDCVAAIGANAFDGCESLESIVLPEGLHEIGDYAFQSCKSLPGLKIPAGVSLIGRDAFRTAWHQREKDAVSFSAMVSPGSYAEQYCKDNGLAYICTEE